MYGIELIMEVCIHQCKHQQLANHLCSDELDYDVCFIQNILRSKD